MATFLDQLRAFLAPRFRVERELRSGGMGTVYYAEDTLLPRAVAVKALRPERASAAALHRFLRETRILAQLDHPNIVPIHDVSGDAAPYPYYIMKYLPEGTLADRLERGALSGTVAIHLGLDLLAALDVAHGRGVIHRDVKPSNIFFDDGRGVLSDFGVAKTVTDADTAVTEPGGLAGTPLYMPPEQLVGRVVPQTDIYALGMVLYEAVTGRHWEGARTPRRADWTGVSQRLRRVLCRALEWAPEDRWQTASEFAHALHRVERSPDARPVLRLIGGVVGLAAVAGIVWQLVRTPRPDLRIGRLAVTGPGAPAALGDSFAARIASGLTGFPDFTVVGPAPPGRARARVSGSIDASNGRLRIRLRFRDGAPFELTTPPSDWRLAADGLADSLLVRLYRSSLLDAQLPVRALPRDPEGLRAFLSAEKLFARAWWDSAYVAYEKAAAVDSTCGLCYFRHAEAGRFLGFPIEAADSARYRARLLQFPPPYQTLIRAEPLPLPQRLDSLDAVVRRTRSFLAGLFRLGDEMLHRGPLIGRSRNEAAIDFTKATEARGDFAPAWEHLAWLRVAEGQQGPARRILDTLHVIEPVGHSAIRDLVQAAFLWRFLPEGEAIRQTRPLVAAASGRPGEPVDAGARYLVYFGAPRGAVWLGEQLEAGDYHRPSAQLAQVFGLLALGRPSDMDEVVRRAHTEFGDPTVDLLGLEVAAARLMFDAAAAPASLPWAELADRLRTLGRRGPTELRWRAEWMAALLERRFGATRKAVDQRTPAPLRVLLDAYDLARGGQLERALTLSDPLTGLPSDRTPDPLLRTILHLLRAEWQEQQGDRRLADLELLWYENSDQNNYPTGDPQSMEVDWAFGTLARWLRLDLAADPADMCALRRDVARLWSDGEPPYAARADSARQLAAGCADANP